MTVKQQVPKKMSENLHWGGELVYKPQWRPLGSAFQDILALESASGISLLAFIRRQLKQFHLDSFYSADMDILILNWIWEELSWREISNFYALEGKPISESALRKQKEQALKHLRKVYHPPQALRSISSPRRRGVAEHQHSFSCPTFNNTLTLWLIISQLHLNFWNVQSKGNHIVSFLQKPVVVL
jgi:hypothetical protein